MADEQAIPSQIRRAEVIAQELRHAGINVFSVGCRLVKRDDCRVWKIVERPCLFDDATGWEVPLMNDAMMELLPDLPHLTEVVLDSTQVTDEGLQQLPRIMNLQEFELSDTQSRYKPGEITDRGISAIARCSELQKLRIWGIPVSDDGWQLLAGLKGVEEITIGYCALSPKALTAIASLPKLKILKLYACECEKVAMCALWRSAALTHLSLQRSIFDLNDLDGIAQCQQITHIDGSFTSINDGAVRDICRLRHLKELNLGSTMITDESVAVLASCHSLKLLLLDISVSAKARDEIRRALPRATVP
jgi:hypothetical protein